MKGVIYARFSSHGQREESIEGQLRVCNKYALEHNIEIIDEYCDRAISGRTDKRDGFQKMLTDSDNHKFECIVMYAVDRFARNVYEDAINKQRLYKNGVKIYYAVQPITDDPEGKLMENLLVGMAEYYSMNLARGVKRGQQQNALQGKWCGGRIPLGIKIVNNRMQVDENTSHIVKDIFNMYDTYGAKLKIAEHLNGKGYRTSQGNKFNINSITRILTNRCYIGEYNYNGHRIENAFESIIDKEQFDKVQDKLKSKRTRPRKAIENYLLTGKLFCGLCGKPMVAENGRSKNGDIHRYYTCKGRKFDKVCSKKLIPKNFIEQLVIDETINKLFTIENIYAIVDKAVELSSNKSLQENNKSILLKEKKQIQAKINNLINAIELGVDAIEIKSRMEELKQRDKDIQKELNSIEKSSIDKEHMLFYLLTILSNNLNDDEEYKQRVINTLIDKIDVYDDRLEVYYNIENTNSNNVTNVPPLEIYSNTFYISGCIKYIVNF